MPNAAMIATAAIVTQKPAHSSETPSAGPTSGPGVELPGVGVYGDRYGAPGSDIAGSRTGEPDTILNGSVRPARLRREPRQPGRGTGRLQDQ